MKRWMRRLLVMFAAVALGLLAVGMVGYHMARAAPAWYRPLDLTPAELAAGATAAQQKLIESLNWATEVQARRAMHRFAAKHGANLPPPESASEPKTISFTDAELNGFFQKWLASRPQLANSVGQYASDIRIALGQDRLILAGKLLKLGSIVSVEIQPSIDSSGKLIAHLSQVDIGTLPMPRAVLSGQLGMAHDALTNRLPAWQSGAKYDADGCANSPAVSAALAKMALALLDDLPGAAVAFLPSVSDHGRPIPVKISNLAISTDALAITIEAPSDAERGEILDQIRAPYGLAEASDASETPSDSANPDGAPADASTPDGAAPQAPPASSPSPNAVPLNVPTPANPSPSGNR